MKKGLGLTCCINDESRSLDFGDQKLKQTQSLVLNMGICRSDDKRMFKRKSGEARVPMQSTE